MAKKRSLDLSVNRKRRATDKEYKAGEYITDIKMETNSFIISESDDSNLNSETTLIADVKSLQQNPSLIGTSLLVTKAKSGQKHSQVIDNGKMESYLNCKCFRNNF